MKAAIVQSAMPTSPTANQDFTDAAFSSDVKLGLLFASRAIESNTIRDEGMLSIGAIDDEANQAVISHHDRDAIGTTNDIRTGYSTSNVMLFSDAAANDSIAEAVGSVLSNGVRAAWSDWNANELISAFMLGGDDVECEVVTATLNGITDVTVSHGLTAAPQAIICLSLGNTASNNGTSCRSIGFFDVGAGTYRCLTHRAASNASTTNITQSWYTDVIAAEHDNAGVVWSATINDVDSDSFDVVAGGADGADAADVLIFICIRVVGGSVKVGDFTTKSGTTGTQADITGTSLPPSAVLYATSFLSSSAGTLVTANNCECLGFGAAVNNEGTTQVASSSMFTSDAVSLAAGQTDTKSLTHASRIASLNGSGALGYSFGVNSWNSDGVTHNYATVDATARRVIYLALSEAPPSAEVEFEEVPVVSDVTTSSFTISYDASAGASNIYAGAWLRGATAPTEAEIKAGTNALDTETEGTTGAADTITITITAIDPFPVYDLYLVLEGDTDDFSSVVALTSQFLDAPAGRQYVVKAGDPDAGEIGVLDGASPAAADGDIMDCSTHANSFTNGAAVNAIALNQDTTAVIDTNSDTSRQDFTIRFYDVSLGDWSESPAATQYWNNSPPLPIGLGGPDDGEDADPYLFEKDIEFSHSVDDLFGNTENDEMAMAAENMPDGASIVDESDWEGAFTAYGVYENVILTATDSAGDTGELDVTITVGRRMPDIVSMAEGAAQALVESEADFTFTVASSEDSLDIPAGCVISQDPAAGLLCPPEQAVTVVMSLGDGEIEQPVPVGWTPVDPPSGVWTPV